jgi:hypothetical protein
MPLILIVVCYLLVFPSPAWADWVLVQTMVVSPPTEGADAELTIKIKGRKMRVDMRPTDQPAAFTSTLSDANSLETITLMHPQKMYTKQAVTSMAESSEQIKQINEQLPTGAPKIQLPAEPSKPQATGKTEKIGPYDAEEYIVESGTTKTRLWLAKDFPNSEAIGTAMRNATHEKLKTSDPTRGLELPGMLLRSENRLGPRQFTMTLISVQEVSLSEADFEPPANYTEIPHR